MSELDSGDKVQKGRLSLARLRGSMTAFVRGGGRVIGKGRMISPGDLEGLLVKGGMESGEARRRVGKLGERKRTEPRTHLVSFDRFFKLYVQTQCYLAVCRLAKSKPNPTPTSVKRCNLNTSGEGEEGLGMDEVERVFHSFFSPEDSREIATSIYSFLKVPLNQTLSPPSIIKWYNSAYYHRRTPRKSLNTIPSESPRRLMERTRRRVREHVERGRTLAVIKGTVSKPLCGFSLKMVQILARLGLVFEGVDVVGKGERELGVVREAWKAEARWPSFPQLWVGKKFIGGSDILAQISEDSPGGMKDVLKGLGARFRERVDEKLVERLDHLKKSMDERKRQRRVEIKGNCLSRDRASGITDPKDLQLIRFLSECASEFGSNSSTWDWTEVKKALDDSKNVPDDSQNILNEFKCSSSKLEDCARGAMCTDGGGARAGSELWCESAEELRKRWQVLKPKLKKKMRRKRIALSAATQSVKQKGIGSQMPCGHNSCNECPTRDDCGLHDLEDLAGL